MENKVWNNMPVLDKSTLPDKIKKELNDCFKEERIYGFQSLEVIEESEKDQYRNCFWIVSKYLKDQGFIGNEILVDNRW